MIHLRPAVSCVVEPPVIEMTLDKFEPVVSRRSMKHRRRNFKHLHRSPTPYCRKEDVPHDTDSVK